MAAFPHESDLDQRVDFRLVADTFVTLFWRQSVLEETIGWLRAHGYEVARLDAAHWTTEADLHRDVADALGFPEYYGRNLNALNDCMRDIVDYGSSPQAAGFVLVLTGYDGFASHCPRVAQAVLDIIARQARYGALVGHRVMCLVQSDDPTIRFTPVGATSVRWNDAEWLDAHRVPDR